MSHFPSWGKSSDPVVEAQPDTIHAQQNRSVLEWCDDNNTKENAKSLF